jgi:hypothetical protein
MSPCPWCGIKSDEQTCPYCRRSKVIARQNYALPLGEEDPEERRRDVLLGIAGGAATLIVLLGLVVFQLRPKPVAELAPSQERPRLEAPRFEVPPPVRLASQASVNSASAARPSEAGSRSRTSPQPRLQRWESKLNPVEVQNPSSLVRITGARLTPMLDQNNDPIIEGVVSITNLSATPTRSLRLVLSLGGKIYPLTVYGSGSIPAGGARQLVIQTGEPVEPAAGAMRLELRARLEGSGEASIDSYVVR